MSAVGPASLDNSGSNHPLAPRMAAIGFLCFNFTIACVMGVYSLLVEPIEARFGVNRELSSLGLPMVYLSLSLMAPVAGVLASKISIRLLMMTGALMMAVGFTVAATTESIYVFLAAYGLLIGPATGLNATILPPTLVTRWFNVHRGRTLGIVHMPILAIGAPPLITLVMHDHGLSGVYVMLAGLMVLLTVALFFVVDYPPNAIDPTGKNVAAEAAAHPGMTVREVLGTRNFWTLWLAYASIMAGAAVLGGHLVPIVTGWGIDASRASGVLSASATGGMIGSVIFGWIADRMGGARALAMLCVNSAILWAIMMFQPPYAVTLVVAILLGMHGAAVVPVFSLALSQGFGQASFGRAFGLSALMSLPFMVSAAPIAARMYVLTGTYRTALLALIGFFLVGSISAMMGRRATPAPLPA